MNMNGRSFPLDGLRGIAAVAVIFYHSILAMGPAPLQVLDPPVQSLSSIRDTLTKIVLTLVNGNTAVLLFFVLSGFVLSLSLQRESGTAQGICGRFLVRRVCRLLPAVIFCMALCYSVASFYQLLGLPSSSHLVAAANPWLALQNAFLIKIGMHGASWTIQAELLAAPFVLAVFLLQRRFGVAGLAVSLAFALLALENPFLLLNQTVISATLYAFVVGMIVADKNVIVLFRAIRPSAIGLLIGAFFLCRLFVPLHSTMATLAQVSLAAVLVAALYAGSGAKVAQWLGSAPAQHLGKVSFSLYLLNVPVMWFVLLVMEPIGEHAPLELGLLAGVLTTLISLPLAVFSEKYFERGGIRLANALLRRERVVPTSSASPA